MDAECWPDLAAAWLLGHPSTKGKRLQQTHARLVQPRRRRAGSSEAAAVGSIRHETPDIRGDLDPQLLLRGTHPSGDGGTSRLDARMVDAALRQCRIGERPGSIRRTRW